jgi:hypothetical protein
MQQSPRSCVWGFRVSAIQWIDAAGEAPESFLNAANLLKKGSVPKANSGFGIKPAHSLLTSSPLGAQALFSERKGSQ